MCTSFFCDDPLHTHTHTHVLDLRVEKYKNLLLLFIHRLMVFSSRLYCSHYGLFALSFAHSVTLFNLKHSKFWSSLSSMWPSKLWVSIVGPLKLWNQITNTRWLTATERCTKQVEIYKSQNEKKNDFKEPNRWEECVIKTESNSNVASKEEQQNSRILIITSSGAFQERTWHS